VTAAKFATCQDEPLASLVPSLKKSAGTEGAFTSSATNLPAGQVARVQTPDDGFVFRWFLNNGAIKVNYTQPTLETIADGTILNNKTVSNPIILQKKNAWYYFIIQNQFLASHPMHLHGHDFSLLGQGFSAWNPSLVSTLEFDNPMRRDTAMLVGARGGQGSPGYTVIGFQTDNPGAWLMHCHIVWHVDGGLALQWVERPDDIPAQQYTSKPSWKKECSGIKNYFAKGGAPLTSGESGLKVRGLETTFVGLAEDNVVRRSIEGPQRHYLEQHIKRSHHF
jgi:hypothetical protein